MDKRVEKLYRIISSNKKEVIFFGLSYCEYSKKTIELLEQNKITYKYYLIDNHYNIFFKVLDELIKLYPNMKIRHHYRTVPVIFIKKKFIGGYTDLKNILNN